MRGMILDFSIQKNKGFISGDDGHQYMFIGADWNDKYIPKQGQEVTFKVDSFGNVSEILVFQLHVAFDNSQNIVDPKYRALLEAEKRYNMFNWFAKCIKNYVEFSGRARRSEYWYFQLCLISIAYTLFFLISIFAAIAVINNSTSSIEIILIVFNVIIALATLLPSTAVSVRRLHDVGRSGWWYFLGFTIVGIIPLIIWFCEETHFKENQWGMPAKDFI